MGPEPCRGPGEGSAGHHVGDGGDPRLVPANPRIDQVRAGGRDRLGLIDHLIEGAAALHKIKQRLPVDENEPLAAAGANRPDDLGRQPLAIGRRATPAVGALIGARRQELVQQVTFRTHDLHPVVARLLGEHRSGGEVLDRDENLLLGQLARRQRVYSRGDRRRGDEAVVTRIAASVEELQHDQPAGLARSGRDLGVSSHGGFAHHRAVPAEPARLIGRYAAGHDQARAALRPPGEEPSLSIISVRRFLKACMHGAHQRAVRERNEPQVQR